MKRLLWGLAWITFLVWSLFAWGAYGLLDFFGGVAARNADMVTGHPETVEWLSWALTTLRGLGLGAIVVVWGLVSLLILAVPAGLGFVLGGSRREQRADDWRGVGRQGSGACPHPRGARPAPRGVGSGRGGSRREQRADDWRGIDRQGSGPFPHPPGQGPVRRIDRREAARGEGVVRRAG